ncbi:MAG: hypothetical protein AVDCRST_MAG86-2319 [uncultured Truepera sp.]|uniref:Uncharacterized protein n=1 Tax=uncultured Truepera sp. TaxID=543023 RepID=A0A6J4VH79_9DEIN|nr:MAG: hypothetical protein AVDCRST_MAG86-2319 [uncultured Truepera sp.]
MRSVAGFQRVGLCRLDLLDLGDLIELLHCG